MLNLMFPYRFGNLYLEYDNHNCCVFFWGGEGARLDEACSSLSCFSLFLPGEGRVADETVAWLWWSMG